MFEQYPNIFCIPVPLGEGFAGHTNCYVLKTEAGVVLIDFGWNAEESFLTLTANLNKADVSLRDIRYLVATHTHLDHYGLINRLRLLTDASLVVHRLDYQLSAEQQALAGSTLEEPGKEGGLHREKEWLRACGMSGNGLTSLAEMLKSPIHVNGDVFPDLCVGGGEVISLGSINLEILWTPGHTKGHICLFDKERRILFSGDHVLEEATPNIGLEMDIDSNPLADYLSSLKHLEELDIHLVLPGHGKPFGSLNKRIEEICLHHTNRLKEIHGLCVKEAKSVFEIAEKTAWFAPWSELPLYSKRAALAEALAHTELLYSRGLLKKGIEDGVFLYSQTE
ncbi:MAG: MBL fold metallo-hydrolase [Coriobacteriia bacterium]|nr:MBL fold metallo-hydrolase [Coriobacteriia bacterium]